LRERTVQMWREKKKVREKGWLKKRERRVNG